MRYFPDLRWLLPVSIITRAAAILMKHPGFPPGWGGEMVAVANSIASGHGFASPYVIETGPTALVPPVYPYLISIVFKLLGPFSTSAGMAMLALNTVISALIVLPLFVLTQRLFNRRAALAAAWVWAVLPIAGYTDALFLWSTSLYTLTLTSFLAATTLFEIDEFHHHRFLYGAFAGFIILVEPISLVVVGLSLAWLLWQRLPAKTLLLILAFTTLLPAIWIVRNSLTFHEPVFIRSGLGLELSRGVRDYELAGNPPISLPNRNPIELEKYKQMGELEYIQSRMDEAIDWIMNHPSEYGTRVAMRFAAFWTGYRVSDIYLFYGRFELAKRIFYSLPVFGAILSLFLLKNRATPLIGIILLIYPAVFSLTHIEFRQRLPLEPLLIGLTVGVIFMINEKRSGVIHD